MTDLRVIGKLDFMFCKNLDELKRELLKVFGRQDIASGFLIGAMGLTKFTLAEEETLLNFLCEAYLERRF